MMTARSAHLLRRASRDLDAAVVAAYALGRVVLAEIAERRERLDGQSVAVYELELEPKVESDSGGSTLA